MIGIYQLSINYIENALRQWYNLNMLINYFINSKQQKKIKILQFLLFEKKSVHFPHMVDYFNLNSSTLRRYLDELNFELSLIFNKKVYLVYSTHSAIKIYNTFSNTLVLEEIRVLYIQNTQIYTTLSLLIRKRYGSVLALSNDSNYSLAATYNVLKTIKYICSEFGIKLDLKSKYKRNFLGDELHVRYFLYALSWTLFLDKCFLNFPDDFPAEFKDLRYLKKSLEIDRELSENQATQLILLSSITCYRIISSDIKVNFPNHLIQDLSLFNSSQVALNIASFIKSDLIIENENILFNYIIRLAIPNIDTSRDKQEIVNKFRKSNLDISIQVATILEKFAKQFHIIYTEENYIDAYYFMLIKLIYIKHFSSRFLPLISLKLDNVYKPDEDSYNSSTFSQIIDFSYTIIFTKNIIKPVRKDFSSLLYYIYKSCVKTPKILIYVSHQNITNILIIKSTILKAFNTDQVSFCDEITLANLVISDRHEDDSPNIRHFFFKNPKDKEIWRDLFHFITDSLATSIFSHTQ